jgi:hypothetical protein
VSSPGLDTAKRVLLALEASKKLTRFRSNANLARILGCETRGALFVLFVGKWIEHGDSIKLVR